MLSVNLRGPVFLARRVAREMIWLKDQIRDYRPSIMFVTSFLAYTSFTNGVDVCISKAGLSMAALVFADRLSEAGDKPSQIIGWKGGDAGSLIVPPDYQVLAGPWVNDEDPVGKKSG